jgi:hypothetical protein
VSTCDEPQNPETVEAQFPSGSTPENRVDNVSALCSYGMRPHVMTGLLRQLLLGHFADPENIDDARVRQQLADLNAWRPEEEDETVTTSGILIESITRWAPNTADKRPAIIIKRNTWQWSKVVIGDKAAQNIYTGKESYFGFWQGSHTIYCMAGTGAETEFLATEVVKFLILFSPLIRTQMELKKFYVSEVGGVGEVQEVVQGYAVPVTVAYVAEENWSIQPYAPRLKRIVFKASDLLSY